MFKIINISKSVVGIMMSESNKLKQKNIMPGKYIIVEAVSEQMKNLADPAKKEIKIEKLEVL